MIWRLLDASREKLAPASATLDLGYRAVLVLGFFIFFGTLPFSDHRIFFYPWLILFPAAAVLLYDSTWVWGMAIAAAVFGVGAAAVEGLFARDSSACLTAFVFSTVTPWIAARLDRSIRRVEDARMMGRVAVREAEEQLTELREITIPETKKEIDQLELQLKKYDRLNRLLLDVPEGKGLPAIAEAYVREAENLIGRGRGGMYIESAEDGVCLTAASEKNPDHARYNFWMQNARPELAADGAGILTPILSEGRPLGILRLEGQPGEFTETDLRILDGLAILASVSVMNSLLYRRMEKLAQTDGLTGLSKRVVFDHALEEELIRAARHGHAVSVALIDIDHFRKFNNTYGHITGDWVLRETARRLQQSMPAYATPARWGGEEFIVLIPNEDAASAGRRVDQFRKDIIESIRIPADLAAGAGQERVTFSAGVAQFPVHAQKAEALVNAADVALYRAKNGGRNQVVMAEV